MSWDQFDKVNRIVIQTELASFSKTIRFVGIYGYCTVRVSDLSLARCYLSIFGSKDKQEVFESIEQNSGRIRGDVGRKLKNLRKIPALKFFIDDSLDYASKIDELLKK